MTLKKYMKIEKNMKKYSKEEKELMNEVYEENYDYIDEMTRAAKKVGKDFISYLFNDDYFLYFCKEYKNIKDNGEDTGLYPSQYTKLSNIT